MPFGLVMRIAGKDPMHRKLDNNKNSYRVDCEPAARENVEHPY
jgi:hypothetical protein